MQALQRDPSPASVVQRTATVIDRRPEGWRVDVDGQLFLAERAASCLVAPQPGDLVLMAFTEEQQPYVLAVLRRAGEGPLRVSTEGALEVEAEDVRISGRASVTLQSADEVAVRGDRLDVSAREGRFFLRASSLLGEAAELVLDRLSQRLVRSLRRVEKLDHLRAGQVDHAADGMMRLHGEHLVTTGERLVKTDAAQIHIG